MTDTDKIRNLHRQIDEQFDLIEDLQETVKNQQKIIEAQNASLREIGFMSCHNMPPHRLKNVLLSDETRVGLN